MKVTPHFSYFPEDIKIYIKSLSSSCNKKTTKTLNVCSLFGVFVYFLFDNKFIFWRKSMFIVICLFILFFLIYLFCFFLSSTLSVLNFNCYVMFGHPWTPGSFPWHMFSYICIYFLSKCLIKKHKCVYLGRHFSLWGVYLLYVPFVIWKKNRFYIYFIIGHLGKSWPNG